jgi:hypothetical protein
MDWHFLVGFGAAIVFGLLAYAVKRMPTPISYAGIAIGVLLIIWGILSPYVAVPTGPALLIIAGLAALVGGAVWSWNHQHTTEHTGQFAGLTNAQLKARTVALGEQMRRLEVDRHGSTLPMLLAIPPPGMTEDQMRACNADRNVRVIRAGEDYELHLQNDILPEARR